MTVTPDLFRTTIQKYVGCDYGFCDRCGGGCHPCQYDCSGLQCKGTNETGLTRNVCTSSFVLAQQCYDLGLLISWERARETDGWWAIRGSDLGRVDDGSKSNGASGHIVYVVRHVDPETGAVTLYTIEAKGRAYGVVNGSLDGRDFDAAYLIPGMDYRPPVALDPMEHTMFIQDHHYDKTGRITGPTKPGDGHDSTIAVSGDGKSIEARWDGSIANDQPVRGDSTKLRRWVSPANPLPDGVTFRAIHPRVPDAEDPHPGGVALLSNGGTRRFHLS